MQRRCEVCQALGRQRGDQPLRRIAVDGRIVALCREHAECAKVETLDELRARFPESSGARSLIDRRSPLDRRVFPARPEGRRCNDGRRVSDAGPDRA
jgi:hypothetical protein